jgi:hypothetical protein
MDEHSHDLYVGCKALIRHPLKTNDAPSDLSGDSLMCLSS